MVLNPTHSTAALHPQLSNSCHSPGSAEPERVCRSIHNVSPSSCAGTAADLDVRCHIASATGNTPEERMAQLMGYMDRFGIQRVVLSLGYPWWKIPLRRN